MSKFKVGDKVRIKCNGSVGTIESFDEFLPFPYTLKNYPSNEPFCADELELIETAKPTREFIVIRRDGQEVIASHKRGDEIVKTAKAKCNPSDEFDFGIGAKLAFKRLTGTEKKEEPKSPYVPQVGDRVKTKFGAGTVMAVNAGIDQRETIVIHDKWSNGHSADCTPKDRALGLSGGRSWYFPPEALRPLNED